MTIGPGAEIYERFGHNAIWIRDTAAHRDLVYNYGEFDFSQPDFYRNFALGVPQYWLAVDDLDGTLAQYQARQRSVTVQELRLTPAQRAEIANRLAVNVEPTHRVYTYNYYSANCSTRVRDLLDDVLGGALRRATQGRPADGTLRFHTLRSIANNVLALRRHRRRPGPAGRRAARSMGRDVPAEQGGAAGRRSCGSPDPTAVTCRW